MAHPQCRAPLALTDRLYLRPWWRRASLFWLVTLIVALCLAHPVQAQQPLRILTWNVEVLDDPGTPQYQAAADILARIDADLVALQEIAGADDVEALAELAFALGYPYLAVSPGGRFGGLRTALLSDLPLLDAVAWESPELSGDPAADDLTRHPFEVTVDLPETDADLRVLINHLKSGSGNDDEFRRAIESYRLTQIVDRIGTEAPYIILGDLNADRGDDPLTPSSFTELPSGLPQSFETGTDIDAKLLTTGLLNDPFLLLGTVAYVVPALQLDGTDATRPESGRALDYVLVDPQTERGPAAAQIYDCDDEGLAGGLPLAGLPLPNETCDLAADHLPVFADLTFGTPAPMNVSYGDCLLNWAEDAYPALFSPAGTATQFAAPDHYRYYRDTNAWLRISNAGNRVIYVDPTGVPQEIGELATWLPAAGCAPPPTACLFDWAEQSFPALFPAGTGNAMVNFTYAYRHYPGAMTALGLSSEDGHLWYLNAGVLRDVGPYEHWMTVSGCF